MFSFIFCPAKELTNPAWFSLQMGKLLCGNDGELEEMESEEYNRKNGKKIQKEQEGKEKADWFYNLPSFCNTLWLHDFI